MRVITAKGETVSQSTTAYSHLSAVPSGAKIITFDTHREETFLKFPAITSREMKSSWVEEWGRTLSMLQVDVPVFRKATVSQQTCSFLATACLHVALKSSTSVSLKLNSCHLQSFYCEKTNAVNLSSTNWCWLFLQANWSTLKEEGIQYVFKRYSSLPAFVSVRKANLLRQFFLERLKVRIHKSQNSVWHLPASPIPIQCQFPWINL